MIWEAIHALNPDDGGIGMADYGRYHAVRHAYRRQYLTTIASCGASFLLRARYRPQQQRARSAAVVEVAGAGRPPIGELERDQRRAPRRMIHGARARADARSHVRRHRRSPRSRRRPNTRRGRTSRRLARAGRQTVSAADVSPQFGMGHCVTSSHLPKNAASAAAVSPRHSPTSTKQSPPLSAKWLAALPRKASSSSSSGGA